jgi:nitrogen fixation protein FixH
MHEIQTRKENGAKPLRPLTGRMVLFYILGFFGVVMAANAVMIYKALSTLSGTDSQSAYQAGRSFERDVAMVRAQDARHWRVDATLTPMADGAGIAIEARDSAGRPLDGLDATATFERPTDRRLDRAVALTQAGAGRFRGSADIAPGQWDLVIELWRTGERQFLSRNRVVLR